MQNTIPTTSIPPHAEPATVSTSAYTPDGFRLHFNITASTPPAEIAALAAQGQALTRALALAGLTPNPAGLEPGEEKKTIASVMRRAKSDGTPIIDFFPAWDGAYGKFKEWSIYIDTPEDRKQFEAQSGLNLDDIALYDGQTALMRTQGQTHPKEVAVKRMFDIAKKQVGEHDNGYPKYQCRYVNEISFAGDSTPPQQSPAGSAPAAAGGSEKSPSGVNKTTPIHPFIDPANGNLNFSAVWKAVANDDLKTEFIERAEEAYGTSDLRNLTPQQAIEAFNFVKDEARHTTEDDSSDQDATSGKA